MLDEIKRLRSILVKWKGIYDEEVAQSYDEEWEIETLEPTDRIIAKAEGGTE